MTGESAGPMPRTFEEWRHCIEHWCGIELSRDYIDRRLDALQDTTDHHTRRFVECYGEVHRLAVVGWFERARREIGGR